MSSNYERQQQRAVTLTDNAVEVLKKMQDATAMPQKHIISRIIEWFADLSDESRSFVLGVLPPSLAEHASVSLIDDTLPDDADLDAIFKQVIEDRRARQARN